jgi:N-acyl-D-aspartate/D-glutamate deacylase
MAAMLMTGCGQAPEPETGAAPLDVLIVNGTVYDGSVNPPAQVNIGVRDGRIVTMDASATAEAAWTIDAAGLVVVPGFIDPHTHAERDIFEVPGNLNENYLTQGVSTVFIGNDGRGFVDRAERSSILENQGIGTNVGWFTGHGTARRVAMGLEDRAPTEAELDVMRDYVEADMQAGALGLSTGLFYRPGSYAETDEVVELAKVAARYDGVYDSHLRDESSYTIGVLGSVAEAIEIGEGADIPVHIAHIKALGRDVWGQSGDIIGLVSAALERGVVVHADQYPWRASGTRLSSSLLPRWVQADSDEAMLERLGNADLRDGIREEMEGNLWRRGGRDSLLITGESEWRGMTLGEIAEQMDMEPVDAAVEVIRGGDPSVGSFNMNPDDINAMAIQPWVMTGSDGSEGHPRKYASYPKAYQDFVVADGLMSMERFVHRSSGQVADAFGLCDRGYLEEGRKADIVVINTDDFVPRADFQEPTVLSTGVAHMLVNGEAAIESGAVAANLAGDLISLRDLDCP